MSMGFSITISDMVFDFELKSVSGMPEDNQSGTEYQVERGSVTLFLNRIPQGANIGHVKTALVYVVSQNVQGIIPCVEKPHKIAEWQLRRSESVDETNHAWVCKVTYDVWDSVRRYE